MIGEANAAQEAAGLTSLERIGSIRSKSFQAWFRDSKVVDASGAPLPVYHASPTTAPLQPKSYGTAGEHSYFYFALSKAWARNFAADFGGANWLIRRFYLALRNPIDLRALDAQTPAEWRRWFSENRIEIDGTPLGGKLDRAPAWMELALWNVLRFDTPLMGGVREQLIAKGYDGLILLDSCRGRAPNATFVAFDQKQIIETTYRRPRLYSGNDTDEKAFCGERHGLYLSPPACSSVTDISSS
jgi:hypothetical protein